MLIQYMGRELSLGRELQLSNIYFNKEQLA